MNASRILNAGRRGVTETRRHGESVAADVSPRLRVPASPRLLACLLALSILPGCATTGGLFKFADHDFPKASEKNPVSSVLALWQPTTGTGLDGLTCRGFAGQVFFFAGDKQLPAEVNGDVRIYVFDDQGSPEDQVKPIHQFDFPANTWKYYLSRTKIGPTYVLFIPYTRKGQHPTQCSLRLRYSPAKGAPLHSDMVNVTLPGSSSSKDTEALANRKAARDASASHEERGFMSDHHGPATRIHRDPAVQLAAATIEQPETRSRPQPLTAAERQRIIEEALTRQGEPASDLDNEHDAAAETDDDVVYVRDDQPAASTRRAPQARSSVKTHTIELPR